MRFAILGDHPDGWSIARALVASGRHMVLAYQGPTPEDKLRHTWPVLRVTRDLEEVLADPQIDAVIVAGKSGERLDQLRRVLQSERPAFCVHPVDRRPDGAYEVNMLQGDVHQVVVPLLPEALHPRVREIGQSLLECPQPPRLIELTVSGPAELLFGSADADARPCFPGWTLLRRLGGEIVEVAAFAATEEVRPGEVILAQGRFANGTLFRTLYLPQQNQAADQMEVTVHNGGETAERFLLADGWTDAALWQTLVGDFEQAVERLKTAARAVPGSGPAAAEPGALSWQEEIRALELDDSTRRSIERRRAYTLEFQEASEDVGFKGTMTLVGCGLLWLIPLLLVISAWFPQVRTLILVVLLVFLGLQLLRWLAPAKANESRRSGNERGLDE